jgi:hypothetical protein
MSKIELFFRRFIVWVILATLLTYLPKRAHADSSTANLSVSVSDSSGAVIAGAHLVLRNSDTNQEQQLDSGKTGSATFSFLKPGHYALTVSADAFADVIVDRILLNVGDDKLLQLSLKVGTAAQTVNVDGSGLTINTTDASVSTVVDRKFVENLPLNGRSFQDLISMTPGVVTQSPQAGSSLGFSGDFSVNGQRTESNSYAVDGVSANIGAGNGYGGAQAGSGGALAASTALGTTQSLVSVDALQEFRVESSSYSAEYGRSPGGQFSFLTRSGTSALHGSAFDYLRNNFFDANDWFNDHYGVKIPALRQNDFGGTLGGPVWLPKIYDGRERTFFFVSYEGLRLTQPQAASIQYVPDAFLRQQAPATLQPILNAYPLPNGIDYGTQGNPSLAEFVKAYSLPSRIDSTSVRLDHTFNSKLSLFFRYGDTPSSTSTRLLSAVTTATTDTQTFTFGATSQLSSKDTNELRLGYALSKSSISAGLDNFGGATPINLADALGAGGYATSSPVFFIFLPSIGGAELTSQNASNRARQFNGIDTFSFSTGHHQLKFGADYRRIASPLNPSDLLDEPIFESSQAILSNETTLTVLTQNIPATPVFQQFALFAQDEWKVSSHLGLSIGLRWELDPPPTENHGNDAYTLLGDISNPNSLTLAPKGTALWKTPFYNFAPRLGVAWTVHNDPGWETVLRAGGGVFFDTNNEVAALGYGGIGFTALQELAGIPAPVTAAQLNFAPSTAPPYTSSTIYAFPEHLQLPYTLEWNVSLQQSLGKAQALTLSYVGSNGRRLMAEQQTSLQSLNPNFGTVVYFPSNVTSNYQALQVQLQRSVAKGVHALASYTWSHSLDLGSNDASLALTRGNSDFDVRDNISGGLSWDLPSIRTGPLLKPILDGWGLDSRLIFRTAFPVSLDGTFQTDPATGLPFFGGLNLVSGQPIYVFGNQYPGGRALNKAAFSVPPPGSTGNAPRNFVRGFGATQLNLAARRDIGLHEGLHLQFRAEAFNLLNHPNFGYVDPTYTDATFGQVTKMLNSSLGTVSPQYQQGGARSMQFALKVLF